MGRSRSSRFAVCLVSPEPVRQAGLQRQPVPLALTNAQPVTSRIVERATDHVHQCAQMADRPRRRRVLLVGGGHADDDFVDLVGAGCGPGGPVLIDVGDAVPCDGEGDGVGALGGPHVAGGGGLGLLACLSSGVGVGMSVGLRGGFVDLEGPPDGGDSAGDAVAVDGAWFCGERLWVGGVPQPGFDAGDAPFAGVDPDGGGRDGSADLVDDLLMCGWGEWWWGALAGIAAAVGCALGGRLVGGASAGVVDGAGDAAEYEVGVGVVVDDADAVLADPGDVGDGVLSAIDGRAVALSYRHLPGCSVRMAGVQ